MKVGIIGDGVVGKACSTYYKNRGDTVVVYDTDPSRDLNDQSVLVGTDLIFICVPTPWTGHQLSVDAVKMACYSVSMVCKEHKAVVIKSTMPVGTTKVVADLNPTLDIFYVPEFLTEKTSVFDFAKPLVKLIGSRHDKTLEALTVAEEYLPGDKYRPILYEEAELAKLATNAFYATKLMFFEQLYDLCRKLEIEYDYVAEAMVANPSIGASHYTVGQDGYRGFAGKCLPKDITALETLFRVYGVDCTMIQMAQKLNRSYIAETKYAPCQLSVS